MTKVKSATPVSAKSWVKPELVLLGQITDVAGNKTLNTNGASVNLLS